MHIGIPREIKNQESRVALPPEAVAILTGAGHTVTVEAGAGVGSGFSDDHYAAAGATPGDTEAAFSAELILKVKEPQPDEIRRFSAGQVLFTYLHLAADRTLTHDLMQTGVTAIAYEAVTDDEGRLPLLAPMSRVAGALAVSVGGSLLEQRNGGRGVLLAGLGGDSDLPGGQVTVVGAGVVGGTAARVAAGMGAQVTVLDRNPQVLADLKAVAPTITTSVSDEETLAGLLPSTDLLIGAVLIPGSRAPRVITRAHLALLPKGAVVVDVAIDQGGSVEGIRTTSHSAPAYAENGVWLSAIANLPGVVPLTSTRALAGATLPYIQRLAGQGWQAACDPDHPLGRGLRAGVRMHDHSICHAGIAEAFTLPYNPPF